MVRCDIRRDLIKCDAKFGNGNNLKVVNKNVWDLCLISKLSDWNPKKVRSGNVYLL